MNTEMIKIFAKQEDRTSVSELITKLAEKLSISPFDMAIVLKGYEPFDVSYDSSAVVCADEKEKYPFRSVLTYSENGLSGDVSLLNIQEREECRSFEILRGTFMGRVFLPYVGRYSEKQVLIAFSALVLMGAQEKPLLSAINEIIKEGE